MGGGAVGGAGGGARGGAGIESPLTGLGAGEQRLLLVYRGFCSRCHGTKSFLVILQ